MNDAPPVAFNPPPLVKVLNYPGFVSVVVTGIVVAALLWVIHRFDPSSGILTISLLVIVAFIGLAAFTVLFSVPTDEVTSQVIGGLVAAFGVIIGYWVSRNKGN